MSDPTNAPVRLRIDFVSDVVCPWCAIGLAALEQALERTRGEVEADIHFQPFELNPGMAAGGEDAVEHLQRKYGMPPAQLEANQQAIVERGAALGFTFDMDRRRRIHNTFDAHRLLHWAEAEGRARELKHALLRGYFTEGRDVSDHDTLADIAAAAGLPADGARRILAGDMYADEVRIAEQFFQANGIRSVPAVILERKHLVSGGQPVDVFEQALRQVAAAKLAGAASA
ncbi:DSBA oxidoreductase [Lysobacter arseniciresistens ZS79]|uniref:DSBA oxidoreductase n=1 Tax=Lysobacter arseniciresistens ZS79 TaxID=913325 RepID=A0A0A0F6H3_9GAMM|nr:DsbA family oxidoreductase [Lysobacter arseniciresistens]KGM56967.1 DSBA oxidoreductase [Lysobacter arseniciresistens ZS79]